MPEPTPAPIRVLLADDHPLTREGIRACLGAAPHLEIVAEAADGAEALRRARQLAPDVVVMDINMPGMNGLAATIALRHECPAVRVLVLTMHEHPEYMVEVIRAGARGYVSKDATPGELIGAIEKVAAGETHFNLPETVRYLRRYRAAPACVLAAPVNALTRREHEVLALIGQGLTNRQVAARLHIGVRTVETHRERLMRKLDIHDVTGLRSYATAQGLTDG
jgi:two-component system, NarL family, nitrate/nitrite response regulator NarL